jgi:hypothetical protein
MLEITIAGTSSGFLIELFLLLFSQIWLKLELTGYFVIPL